MSIKNTVVGYFKDHPRRTGFSYLDHLQQTMIISLLSLICFVLFFVHAVFPMLFEEIGNDLLLLCHKLNDDMITKVHRDKNFITVHNGRLSSENLNWD